MVENYPSPLYVWIDLTLQMRECAPLPAGWSMSTRIVSCAVPVRSTGVAIPEIPADTAVRYVPLSMSA